MNDELLHSTRPSVRLGTALWVVATRATHPELRSLSDLLEARNEHVKHLAVTYLLLWHAIPGLLAAAVPGTEDRSPR